MVDWRKTLSGIEGRLRQLEDEAAIRVVLASYGRAIDRGDQTALSDIFVADAEIHYGSDVYEGDGAGFAPAVLAIRQGMVRTQHLLGQSVIKIAGTSAHVETYGQAVHIISNDGQLMEFVTGNRYLDDLRRNKGRWQITKRQVVIDWARELIADDGLLVRVSGPPIGAYGSDDPSANFL